MEHIGRGYEEIIPILFLIPEKVARAYIYQPVGDLVTVNSGRVNWFGREPEWKDMIDFRGANDVEKSVGEWNTLECHILDGEITIYLNRVLVNRALDVKPRSGKIQIQSEGAEVLFSRVDLTPINRKERQEISKNTKK